MKPQALILGAARPRSARSITLATLLLLFGCVSLDKPESVTVCSSSPTGCSDNSLPDAALPDTGPKNPDLAPASDFAANPDTQPDLAADTTTGTPDAMDGPARLDGGIGKDGGIVDVVSVDLASDDVAGPDLAALDLAGPDLRGPDLARPDLPSDTAPGNDSAPESALDVGRDQSSGDTSSGNCITQIIANGYAFGTVPPCSACKDNSTSLATQCTGMLDCLAPPRTSSSFTDCLNSVGGSATLSSCVTALTTAGCPSGY